MIEILKFKFLDALTWPRWVGHMIWDSGLLDECKPKKPPLEKWTYEDRQLIMQHFVDFTKAHPYKGFTLEMIDNELWAIIPVTPEITMIILNT